MYPADIPKVFSYHCEQVPCIIEPHVSRVSQHPYGEMGFEMAKRLAHFLWQSAPDEGCSRPPREANWTPAGATEYDAVKVAASDFLAAYRLNAELHAMELRCDLVRFGNIMFEASGGHTAFEGDVSSTWASFTTRESTRWISTENAYKAMELKMNLAETNTTTGSSTGC